MVVTWRPPYTYRVTHPSRVRRSLRATAPTSERVSSRLGQFNLKENSWSVGVIVGVASSRKGKGRARTEKRASISGIPRFKLSPFRDLKIPWLPGTRPGQPGSLETIPVGDVDLAGTKLQKSGFYNRIGRFRRTEVSLKLVVMATEGSLRVVPIWQNLERKSVVPMGSTGGSGLANPGAREIAWGSVRSGADSRVARATRVDRPAADGAATRWHRPTTS
jgi:hypothetical protein